jgi:hypothetical protein
VDEDAKNRFNACTKMADYWAGRYEGRRQFEWKITLAWWGLIVLGVRYMHSTYLQTIGVWGYAVLSILAAVALLSSFVGLWLYPLWRANTLDKEQSFASVRSAEGLLLDQILGSR